MLELQNLFVDEELQLSLWLLFVGNIFAFIIFKVSSSSGFRDSARLFECFERVFDVLSRFEDVSDMLANVSVLFEDELDEIRPVLRIFNHSSSYFLE